MAKEPSNAAPPKRAPGRDQRAFTLVELLVTIAIIAILASLLMPGLARAQGRGRQLYCLSNLRNLTMALMLYTQDNSDRLAYNLGSSDIKDMLDQGQHYNWANSVLDWELSAGNTNMALNTEASLGSYIAQNGRVFRCPMDRALSRLQRTHQWTERSRSFSMNAMAGDAGEFTRSGANVNNPTYKQFLKLGQIEVPESIFVFIEEHPDSIGDGYFLNKYNDWEWYDLPASYHNGAANMSFADGHMESHRWRRESTLKPARPDVIPRPFELETSDWADFDWLMKRMSTR